MKLSFFSIGVAAILSVFLCNNSNAYVLFGQSWPDSQATIYSTGGDSSSTFDSAFVEAMNNWNNLSDFQFINASGFKDPCADPNTYGPPRFSGYAFRSDSCGTSFGSSTLAVNWRWTYGITIVQAGTVFNSVWSWDVHSGSSSNIDFRRVATHELGHALGLGHESVNTALMNPFYSETIETSQSDDIEGIRAIYGGTGSLTNIALKAGNGQYIVAEGGGGGAVYADRNAIGGWETFELVDQGNSRYALKANNGQYLVAEGGGGGAVYADRNAIGGWETFEFVDLGSNTTVAIKANNGQYLQAESGGGGVVNAGGNAIGSWETFELVDLGNNQIALKASNNQYLVAEGSGGGLIYANRDSRGPWETFERIDQGSNRYALKASNGQYLAAEGGGGSVVYANRNAVGAWETFEFVSVGTKLSVAFKTNNGQYLQAEDGGGGLVGARGSAVGSWETFEKIELQ